jgi:hypothetical protein
MSVSQHQFIATIQYHQDQLPGVGKQQEKCTTTQKFMHAKFFHTFLQLLNGLLPK